MKLIFKSKLVLSLAAFLMIAAAIAIPFSGSIARSHAASPPKYPIFIKNARVHTSSANGGNDVYLGTALVLYFYYPTCDATCGNETWFAKNIPPNTTSTFNPPVTTGSNTVTWTLQTLQNTPLGTYTVTVGAVSDNPNVTLGTLDIPVNIVSTILTLPFPNDTNMNIQQGWYYTNGNLHQGIDYIDGTIDSSSTWKNFAVLAALDGEACADTAGDAGGCVKGPGNRVLIRHDLGNGVILYTYYGHLNWIPPWIPVGNRSNTVHVTRGSEIGTSGETGTAPMCLHPCVHLHFSLAPPSFSWIDPYDLNTTREKYPNPNGTNGLTSGPNNYWTANPPVYAPGFGTKLGGVNLNGYCKSIGDTGASLDGKTAFDWHCVTQSGAHVGITVTAACQWQYKRSDASALWNNYFSPYSWRCYA